MSVTVRSTPLSHLILNKILRIGTIKTASQGPYVGCNVVGLAVIRSKAIAVDLAVDYHSVAVERVLGP